MPEPETPEPQPSPELNADNLDAAAEQLDKPSSKETVEGLAGDRRDAARDDSQEAQDTLRTALEGAAQAEFDHHVEAGKDSTAALQEVVGAFGQLGMTITLEGGELKVEWTTVQSPEAQAQTIPPGLIDGLGKDARAQIEADFAAIPDQFKQVVVDVLGSLEGDKKTDLVSLMNKYFGEGLRSGLFNQSVWSNLDDPSMWEGLRDEEKTAVQDFVSTLSDGEKSVLQDVGDTLQSALSQAQEGIQEGLVSATDVAEIQKGLRDFMSQDPPPSDADKTIEIAKVMLSNGVNVVGKDKNLIVRAPKDKMEMGMNKLLGLFLLIAGFIEKFEEMRKGETGEEEKDEGTEADETAETADTLAQSVEGLNTDPTNTFANFVLEDGEEGKRNLSVVPKPEIGASFELSEDIQDAIKVIGGATIEGTGTDVAKIQITDVTQEKFDALMSALRPKFEEIREKTESDTKEQEEQEKIAKRKQDGEALVLENNGKVFNGDSYIIDVKSDHWFTWETDDLVVKFDKGTNQWMWKEQDESGLKPTSVRDPISLNRAGFDAVEGQKQVQSILEQLHTINNA